jgi:enoyl-CoA hydratase/carnithine racemase
MCALSGGGWIGGGDVDEFAKADRDDWELEKAQDRYESGRTDWADLHEYVDRVESYEAIVRADKKRVALGTELPLEEEFDG